LSIEKVKTLFAESNKAKEGVRSLWYNLRTALEAWQSDDWRHAVQKKFEERMRGAQEDIEKIKDLVDTAPLIRGVQLFNFCFYYEQAYGDVQYALREKGGNAIHAPDYIEKCRAHLRNLGVTE